MSYGTADDIILKGPGSQGKPKKGKAGRIILILFLLIIILGGAVAGYWYYINYIQETPKTAFFKYVGNSNINNILDLDLYYNMIEQMSNKSFLAETTADFTTNIKNNLTENVDSSKFDFNINVEKDKNHKKALLDAKVSYLSNDLFDLKILDTDKSIGIISTDITDKYIASSKDELDESIRKSTGMQTSSLADNIDNFFDDFNNNRIKFDEEYKKQKANEYFNTIYTLIPEESVTKKENVVVTNNSETINTNAYILKINQNKQKEIVKAVLEQLKNDDELLSKIVTGEKKKEINVEKFDESEIQSNENTIAPITNIQTKTEVVEGEEELHETEMTINDENSQFEIMSVPETDLVKKENLNSTDVPSINVEPVETYDNIEVENDLYKQLIEAIILKRKINCTVEELKDKINNEINNVSSIKDDIEMTVYVRNESSKEKETIKLFFKISDKNSIDVEYSGNTKLKLTYLGTKKDEDEKEISVGNSIEIEKISTDVNVKYNILYNEIEKAKVVSKTQIELQTNNSNSSKGYTNNIIVKYTDNSEGDLKVNIKNEIKFQEIGIDEDLNDNNSIFLNKLSNEEAENLFIEIFEKVMSTYEEKMANLNFIDNNSSKSVIQQPEVQKVNNEEKEIVKKKLIEVVSNMMWEAEQRGENLTIQDLKELSIEGYDVSSSVSEELAIIKMNGYTFNIDKDFNLSE